MTKPPTCKLFCDRNPAAPKSPLQQKPLRQKTIRRNTAKWFTIIAVKYDKHRGFCSRRVSYEDFAVGGFVAGVMVLSIPQSARLELSSVQRQVSYDVRCIASRCK